VIEPSVEVILSARDAWDLCCRSRFEFNCEKGAKPKELTFLDFMEFSEDYADYVVAYEKYMDRSGSKTLEALYAEMKEMGSKNLSEHMWLKSNPPDPFGMRAVPGNLKRGL
jgi:hypothetical protein